MPLCSVMSFGRRSYRIILWTSQRCSTSTSPKKRGSSRKLLSSIGTCPVNMNTIEMERRKICSSTICCIMHHFQNKILLQTGPTAREKTQHCLASKLLWIMQYLNTRQENEAWTGSQRLIWSCKISPESLIECCRILTVLLCTERSISS